MRPCIDISDNPGGRAAARRNGRLCKLCCPAPVMYLLNTVPTSHTPDPIRPVSRALRKWCAVCTIGLYFSTLRHPLWKIREWNAWQLCLFSSRSSTIDDPSIRSSSRVSLVRDWSSFFLYLSLFLSLPRGDYIRESFDDNKRRRALEKILPIDR